TPRDCFRAVASQPRNQSLCTCKIGGFPRLTMAKATQPTSIPGPAFIRLIARLTDARLTDASPALADRLSEWVDWTRAVALSKALDGRLPAVDTDAPVACIAEEQEYTLGRAAPGKA